MNPRPLDNLNEAQNASKSTWIIGGSTTLFLVLIIFAASGCKPKESTKLEKKPRPVEVKVLATTQLKTASIVTAPVGSWKTEQIGFEVSGRIETVVEPNTDINCPDLNEAGQSIPSTAIAHLNPEQYELQVRSQQAQVSRATQAIKAAEIQLDTTLPAQMRAAQAEMKRAETEYERSKRLVSQNAGAQSDVDRDEASYNTALSQISQLEASKDAQLAELESLRAQLDQAKESLKDAQRNLQNCTLYSSFPGQIAEVAVVPGSVVAAGTPVATIQMMDPIKVEVEVSAEDTRRVKNRQRIPVLVTREDGTEEELDGFLYLVDSVADSQTRTFTLTLLVGNERLTEDNDPNVPTTKQTWPVNFEFLNGGKDIYFASDEAIFEDDEGFYVWHVTNVELHGDIPQDRVLNVRKARIQKGPSTVPFLGNWTFQQIEILDSQFDPNKNLITSKLSLGDEETRQWSGDQVLFQKEAQWMLRPGDLVKVNLADNVASSGLYVPMDAIGYEMDRTFLFLISEKSAGDVATVERVEVNVASNAATSSIVAIEPIDSSVSIEGRKYVSRGAHYLVDGERVRPVESEGTR